MKWIHIQQSARKTAEEKGFHTEKISVPHALALMHSELSEALEEHRQGMGPTDVEHVDGYVERFPKEIGIPSELADVVIRVADFCQAHGFDLTPHIRRKLAFNETRPWMNGKVRE